MGRGERRREEPGEEAAAKDKPEGVIFYPVRCPDCESDRVKCYSSEPPGPNRVRYHLCRACGKRFKSIEAPS